MSRPFLRHDGREFHRLVLGRPTEFDLPFADQPYPCLLWNHGGGWTMRERESLSKALIATDCRYAVSGGVGCQRWHDDIDLAFLITVPETEAHQRFVMTSWHTDESPLEVAMFFAWNTNFERHDFRHFLLIELGTDSTESDVAGAVVRAVTEPDTVVDELDGGTV